MQSYRSLYNIQEERFDTDFPLFLQEKNILPNLYEQTIEGCSTLIQVHLDPLKDIKRISIITNTITTVICAFAFLVALILYLVNANVWLSYIVYGFPAISAFGVIMLSIINIIKTHKIREKHLNAKQVLLDFISQENQDKYQEKGVKLILHYDTYNGFGKYRASVFSKKAEPPCIEIIFINVAQVVPAARPGENKLPLICRTTYEKPFNISYTTRREEGRTPVENPLQERHEQNQPLLAHNKYRPV